MDYFCTDLCSDLHRRPFADVEGRRVETEDGNASLPQRSLTRDKKVFGYICVLKLVYIRT